MATAKPQEYGNESISQLKGADRVFRPIFSTKCREHE